MEITGRLFKKMELQTGTAKTTGNPWSKLDFVIETLDSYPKKLCFSLMNDRIHLLDQFQIDYIITVSFDVESREYQDKWYTSLRAWKVEVAQPAQMQGMPAPGYQQPQGFPQQPVFQQPAGYAQPTQQPVYQQPIQQPVYQQSPQQNYPNQTAGLPPQPQMDTFTDNDQSDDLPF